MQQLTAVDNHETVVTYTCGRSISALGDISKQAHCVSRILRRVLVLADATWAHVSRDGSGSRNYYESADLLEKVGMGFQRMGLAVQRVTSY